MYSFSQNSLKRLSTAHPDLQEIMEEAIRRTPIDFGISHGHRTPQEQLQLFLHGRLDNEQIVTYRDGYNKKSKHNEKPSHAVDVYAFVNGRASWEETHLREIASVVKAVAREKGIAIAWGGDWTRFKDLPHFELI